MDLSFANKTYCASCSECLETGFSPHIVKGVIVIKKLICISLALTFLLLTACSASTPTPSGTDTPMPTDTVESAIANASADELRGMIAQYQNEGSYELVYSAALRLMELEPEDASAYIDASEALLKLSEANIEEINRLLQQGSENAQEEVGTITDWAKQNQPNMVIDIPFAPDYTADAEINVNGITTGNLSNAAKYSGLWLGGLLTWQGDWVYLTRPDENFAIYKMQADGSDYQRIGEECGTSLNVVGDWLYYSNINDGFKPYKMRTDGSMVTKIYDEECGMLSLWDDWIFFDGGGLWKMRTDGSDLTMLFEETVIFSCVSDGWIYFNVKSLDGGLWRISTEGGSPQQIVDGFVQIYAVVDDWVYYLDINDPNCIRRVHPDGTGDEILFTYDVKITTFNVSGSTLSIGFGLDYEEDGFLICSEILTLDINTLAKKQHIEANTEPICTGPDGWVYFMKFSEGLAWYAMNESGDVVKVG